jgi:putative tryptophan/tyrosine transport system substrate-binding protein
MLKEMVPQLARVAIMYNPNSVPDAGKFFSRPFIASATKLKVRPITAEVHDPSQIENAVKNLGTEPGRSAASCASGLASLLAVPI